MQGLPGNGKLKINPDDLEDMKCEEEGCGGIAFIPAVGIKRLSGLLVGESQDRVVPYEIMVCAKCGNPVPFMIGNPQQGGSPIVGG